MIDVSNYNTADVVLQDCKQIAKHINRLERNCETDADYEFTELFRRSKVRLAEVHRYLEALDTVTGFAVDEELKELEEFLDSNEDQAEKFSTAIVDLMDTFQKLWQPLYSTDDVWRVIARITRTHVK